MAISAITTSTPGNLVVPLSAIMDQLKGKLSASDLNALLVAVTARMTTDVHPGDRITASLMTNLLRDVADLQLRVASLENSGPSEPGTPTVGFIAVSYQGSPRGTNVVPNDAKPFPHSFMLNNYTNKDLTYILSTRVTGASGDWSRAATFENNMNTRSVVVPQSASLATTVNVVAPSFGTNLGDTPILQVTATTSRPDALSAAESVQLLVAASESVPVTRTLRLTSVAEPYNFTPGPSGADGKIACGKVGSFALSFKYDDSMPSPPEPGFSLEVRLEAGDPEDPQAMKLWDVEMQGATPDVDKTTAGVRLLKSNVASLPLGQPTTLAVSLAAPDKATRIKFAASLRSTKLADHEVEVSTKTYAIASV